MVIQRWQSLLLLAAAVAMACFAFCTIGQISTADYSLALSSLGFSYEGIHTGDTLRMVPAHLVLFRSCDFGHNPPVVSDFYVQKLQAPETAHHRLHAPVHGRILHSVALGIQCHRRIGRLLELFRPVRACYCRSCPLARMALHMPRPETARVNRQAQVIRKSTIIAARTGFYQN